MSDLLHFNGINAATGDYALPPMAPAELARMVTRQAPPENLDDLKRRKARDDVHPEEVKRLEAELASKQRRLEELRAHSPPDPPAIGALTREIAALAKELDRRRHFGVKEGIDATNLAQAGWGIVFAHKADPAIREALSPLLALRQAQAGERFHLYEGPKAWRPGESKSAFLSRLGAAPSGPAEPEKVPYYLLLVGGPSEIPFPFQYQLDVQYAVGRLHFDTPAEYAHYAASVVAAETEGAEPARRLSFFGVASPDDRATELAARLLVGPLHEDLGRNQLGFSVDSVPPEEATKGCLARLLGGGAGRPAVLFTASHGMEFPEGDARQAAHQGALLCRDWPGPQAWRGAIPADHYFSGDDLPSSADLRGSLVFSFACFSAGTPREDEFFRMGGAKTPKPIAPQPFLSGLGRRMLSLPKGALALVGHVDRAWGYSFASGGGQTRRQTAVFQSTLERLMKGQPVGWALEYFNQRYAELSTVLNDQISDIEMGLKYDPNDLAVLWTTNHDARGYIVIGDPAVRLFARSAPVGAETAAARVATAAPPISDAPPGISEEDWQRTPESVRDLVRRALAGRSRP